MLSLEKNAVNQVLQIGRLPQESAFESAFDHGLLHHIQRRVPVFDMD